MITIRLSTTKYPSPYWTSSTLRSTWTFQAPLHLLQQHQSRRQQSRQPPKIEADIDLPKCIEQEDPSSWRTASGMSDREIDYDYACGF